MKKDIKKELVITINEQEVEVLEYLIDGGEIDFKDLKEIDDIHGLFSLNKIYELDSLIEHLGGKKIGQLHKWEADDYFSLLKLKGYAKIHDCEYTRYFVSDGENQAKLLNRQAHYRGDK